VVARFPHHRPRVLEPAALLDQGGCDPDHGAMLISARWNAA
jgi:hypothetical protein